MNPLKFKLLTDCGVDVTFEVNSISREYEKLLKKARGKHKIISHHIIKNFIERNPNPNPNIPNRAELYKKYSSYLSAKFIQSVCDKNISDKEFLLALTKRLEDKTQQK